MLSLKRDDRIWVDEEVRIMENFKNFYEKLFWTERNGEYGDTLDIIPRVVNEEMNKRLIKEVSEEEVMKVAFELGAMKAPGPDGFNGVFYQKY